MKLIIGRAASILVFAGGWIVTGVRTVLDLIGYATIPDDAKTAQGLLEQTLQWVLGLPYWLPWGFALAATALLMWVSWPRPTRAALPVAAEPAAEPKETTTISHVPTWTKLQFKAGAENVVTLDNRNLRVTHCQRVMTTVIAPGNQPQSAINWYVFLVFAKPTTYGQIVVDAGNAAIPQYSVVSQTFWSAIVSFKGDVGNVAVEIRCVAPKPSE